MKYLFFFIFSFSLLAQSPNSLTDEEAIALGMTPVRVAPPGSMSFSTSFNPPMKKFDPSTDLEKAKIVIFVNKGIRSKDKNPTGQTASVYQNGVLYKTFNVSTGTEMERETTSGRKYIATTPVGYFRPQKAYKEYQSGTFLGANMTYAVFFIGGIALHSTTKDHYKMLGKRDSGGCVRFTLEDAKKVNELIRSTGTGSNEIRREGTATLKRNRYIDSIALNSFQRFLGIETESEIQTYDALIIVQNGI